MEETTRTVQVVPAEGVQTTIDWTELFQPGTEPTESEILERVGLHLDQPGAFVGYVVQKTEIGVVISRPAVYG